MESLEERSTDKYSFSGVQSCLFQPEWNLELSFTFMIIKFISCICVNFNVNNANWKKLYGIKAILFIVHPNTQERDKT